MARTNQERDTRGLNIDKRGTEFILIAFHLVHPVYPC